MAQLVKYTFYLCSITPIIHIYRGLKPTHSTYQPLVDYCNKYSSFYTGQSVAIQQSLLNCDPLFRPTRGYKEQTYK